LWKGGGPANKEAMATHSILPDTVPPRRPAKWRRTAPFAALCFLFAIGAGLGLAYEAQQAWRGHVSTAVLQHLLEGGAGRLVQAALLLLLWMGWNLARKIALYAAFWGVEGGFAGAPADRHAFRFALRVQFAIALLYAFGAALLVVLVPFRIAPAPLINLGQAEVESLLGPLAPVALALAALLVYDFMSYWLHRAQHRFAFLWRFHAVHHSVEGMDSLNSYTHPVDTFAFYAGMVLIAVAIGFTFETMIWFLAFQTIHDRLNHTRAPVNFGMLGGLLVDNRTHFVHHTRVEARSGRNFAATFTIFDRLFGTYERPRAGALIETGLEGQGPPATLRDFFLGRLDRKDSAEPAGFAVSGPKPGGDHRSRPSA
jgi:sterol desaturase/sphingolipid hydroxylase (fatty acid hydroxylase superfamily)